jgi:SpoVK/Ycf46/Vps4 family AAA+-type ATPase
MSKNNRGNNWFYSDGDDGDESEAKMREYVENTQKEMEKVSRHSHYAVMNGIFFPQVKSIIPTTKTLPAGVYEVARIPMKNEIFFSPLRINSDEIVELNESSTSKIIADVALFLSDDLKEKYKKFGLMHKRGAILEGPPGTGKSINLTQIARKVVSEFKAIVLFNPSVDVTLEALRIIREVEPNKPVVVMYEEFDSLLGGGTESTLLTMLDGQISLTGVYFLCTTNYISRIPARLKNRPSRFALVVNVGKPTKGDREKYIRTKLVGEDEGLIASLVDNSKDMVIDQIKDLIVSVCCFGYPMSDAVRKIKEMSDAELGIDDYNELSTKSVFKSLADDGPKKPLRPV